MSVPATTAVTTGPRPAPRASGAAMAPASTPCAKGSVHARISLAVVIEGVVVDGLRRTYNFLVDMYGRLLSQAGYPLFTSMQSCARALAAMVEYRAARERR